MLSLSSQELKHKKSSLRRRQEEVEHDEEATKRERTQILETLRVQAGESDERLEAERRRQKAVELELGTLRGRLTHVTKEQGQWEQDYKAASDKERDEAMEELRRLRRKHGSNGYTRPPAYAALTEK